METRTIDLKEFWVAKRFKIALFFSHRNDEGHPIFTDDPLKAKHFNKEDLLDFIKEWNHCEEMRPIHYKVNQPTVNDENGQTVFAQAKAERANLQCFSSKKNEKQSCIDYLKDAFRIIENRLEDTGLIDSDANHLINNARIAIDELEKTEPSKNTLTCADLGVACEVNHSGRISNGVEKDNLQNELDTELEANKKLGDLCAAQLDKITSLEKENERLKNQVQELQGGWNEQLAIQDKEVLRLKGEMQKKKGKLKREVQGWIKAHTELEEEIALLKHKIETWILDAEVKEREIFDKGFILGAVNVGGLDGLQKELNRLKKIGRKPSDVMFSKAAIKMEGE